MRGTGIRGVNPAARAVLVVLAGFLPAAHAQSDAWERGRVEGSIAGSYSSLRMDAHGNGHVCYMDESSGVLQYSFWSVDLNKWFTTTLDNGTGFASLALDSKQRPHISYAAFGKLKHVYWDGSSWQKEVVPLPSKEITYYTSIALDAEDNPSMSFYEIVGASGDQMIRLRVITWAGGVWELSTVDQDRGSGKFNSIAVDSAGRRHVAYGNVSYENASLRYARWIDGRWKTEILEGAGVPGTYRQAVMLILDREGRPHIAYSDVLNRAAKYATVVDGKWVVQTIGPVAAVAYPDRNGLALDDRGTPYVSYYDPKRGVLTLGYRDGQRWITEIVDDGFAGFTSSLQIHDGTIWITYSGGPGGGLKFARRPIGKAGKAQLEAKQDH